MTIGPVMLHLRQRVNYGVLFDDCPGLHHLDETDWDRPLLGQVRCYTRKMEWSDRDQCIGTASRLLLILIRPKRIERPIRPDYYLANLNRFAFDFHSQNQIYY